MVHPLRSLIESGTKLYLDTVDPDELEQNLAWGATGATSNPAIIQSIIKTGRLDHRIEELLGQGLDDSDIAWKLTDELVLAAQERLLPIWEHSAGNEGWVSFELDPLLEDPEGGIENADRTERYIELGRQWSAGQPNRMIKVPATEAGLAALETLAADGITLNITLIFTDRQYRAAREALWSGAMKRGDIDHFKSVYSVFISRIDVYTAKHVPELSEQAQGQVGILNAKRMWHSNQQWWQERPTRLQQEMIFASTGTKDPKDPPWKYVQALAGSDIQTNPPETNRAIAESDLTFSATVAEMPPEEIQQEIDEKVDYQKMETVLMEEGIAKFAKPQYDLLDLIAEKRRTLSAI